MDDVDTVLETGLRARMKETACPPGSGGRTLAQGPIGGPWTALCCKRRGYGEVRRPMILGFLLAGKRWNHDEAEPIHRQR